MKLTDLQSLVILGFLNEKPHHGYQIRKRIRENFGFYTGFTPQSIYYSLKKLEKNEFLTKRKEKIGGRPEREIYEITEKGRKEFHHLLEKSLEQLYRPFFTIDIGIYFLKNISKKKFIEKIKKQERTLREIRVWAKKEKKKVKFPYSLIFHHIEKTTTAEIEFLEDLKSKLNLRI